MSHAMDVMSVPDTPDETSGDLTANSPEPVSAAKAPASISQPAKPAANAAAPESIANQDTTETNTTRRKTK